MYAQGLVKVFRQIVNCVFHNLNSDMHSNIMSVIVQYYVMFLLTKDGLRITHDPQPPCNKPQPARAVSQVGNGDHTNTHENMELCTTAHKKAASRFGEKPLNTPLRGLEPRSPG